MSNFSIARRSDYYLGYPSAINVLAQYLLENNIQLRHPPQVCDYGVGIVAPGDLKREFARPFGATATDHYGMAEFAGNMAKCEHGRYHLDFECGSLEGLPLSDADRGRQSLLLTGWGNPAMPFIRYEVGDYGTPADRVLAPAAGNRRPLSESMGGRKTMFAPPMAAWWWV